MCNFDDVIKVVCLEKLAYMGYDVADEEIALSRSPTPSGGRNPENRNHDSVLVGVQTDGERVKEGAVGT